MKKALCVVATLIVMAGMANAELVPLQIVASPYEYPASPTDGSVLGDAAVLDGGANPQVLGGTTLNVWAKTDLNHVWNGVAFDLQTTGDVTATAQLDLAVDKWTVRSNNGKFRINAGDELGLVRWNSGSDATANSEVAGDILKGVAVLEPGMGGTGDLGIGATSVYSGGAYTLEQRGTWFKLGTITVQGTDGSVFLGYQTTNFLGGLKGESIMYYGYGASGIVNLDANVGMASDAPFVTVIPEPASFLLLALAGLAIRRR